MTFEYVKVGDKVTRLLAGIIPMELTVTEVTDDLISCGPWQFERITGYEFDEDIPCLVSHLVHKS